MNQKERKEYRRVYYLTHKKEMDACNKAYCLAHAEEIKVKKKAYYLAHKKEITEQKKAYYLARKESHKEQIRTQNKISVKKYALTHKEAVRARHKLYQQKHPEKSRFQSRKRRALKCKVNCESYNEYYIFERDGWICGICGRKINKRLKYPNPLSKSIDHIVPLSKGGNDSPGNVQAAHLRCNMLKSTQNGGQLRLIG